MGHISVPCEKKKGQLWVHVTDDAGVDLPNIPIRIGDGDSGPTNGEGLVKRANLEPASLTVRVSALDSAILEKYSPPDPRSKDVQIADGTIAYVPFLLQRLSGLKVKIFCTIDPDPRALIKNVVVRVTSDQGGLTADTTDGVADFGKVKPGTHMITIEFVDPAQNHYDLLPRVSDTIELLPGKDGELEFDVEPLYKKVQFIGHCLLTIPKAKYEANAWKAEYNGDLDDAEDVRKRVAFLKANLLKAQSAIVDRADELKIFMVPECFFLGKYGGYEIATLPDLVVELQKLVEEASWKHWLFVFGTVNGQYTWPAWSDLNGASGAFEMFNNAPVIRGGCQFKGASGPEYTRMIQKAEFSAELLSDAELKKDPLAKRVQMTTELARGTFGETENEGAMARYLSELVSDPEPTLGGKSIAALFTEQGLTPGDWNALKVTLKGQQATKGPVAMVREIRACKLSTAMPLSDLAKYCAETESVLTPEAVAWRLLRKSAGKVNNLAFRRKSAPELLDLVNGVIATCDTPATAEPGIKNFAPMAGSTKALLEKIALDLAADDKDTFSDVWDATPKGDTAPVWTLAPTGITRKLLDMLLEERGVGNRGVLIAARQRTGMQFQDFTFACARKPGPIVDLPGAADPRMVLFGLEICADHSTSAMARSSGTKVPLDIQLVPSAGMSISLDSAAVTKDTGYVFNCDGWNKNSALHKGRNVPIVEVYNAAWPEEAGRNPLTPHTELIKKNGVAMTPINTGIQDAAGDHSAIFADTAGKLHIYPIQKLPEVNPTI
ncbi:MAG: hypothetical protein JST65_21040 [Acidobacteria bacterium]|nr:hypothetical protein [Acidobacteriota bacterium]